MAGKHKGPLVTKDQKSSMTRITLSQRIDKVVREMADAEMRSHGNMVSVLVLEALKARGVKVE